MKAAAYPNILPYKASWQYLRHAEQFDQFVPDFYGYGGA